MEFLKPEKQAVGKNRIRPPAAGLGSSGAMGEHAPKAMFSQNM
jgi:hypothetical protein